MKRTNIYLSDERTAALDELARGQGLSRAELIRRLLDRAIGGSSTDSLADDLAAIDDSFGVLRDDGDFDARGPDERSRHLDRIARL